jgi:hypothetical protein
MERRAIEHARALRKGFVVIIRPLLFHIRWVVIALIISGVGTARAESRLWSPQVVDGYSVTLSLTAEPAPPGDSNVVVVIRDPQSRAVDGALVSAALLAYTPGVSTSATAPATAGQHIHSPAAGRTTEPQGLIPVPVQLVAGPDAGVYRGMVSFAREGTWTVVVAFTIDKQSRAVLFKVGIIDQRPRLALLAEFAAVNAAIIGTAAVCRRIRSSQRRLRVVSQADHADSARL